MHHAEGYPRWRWMIQAATPGGLLAGSRVAVLLVYSRIDAAFDQLGEPSTRIGTEADCCCALTEALQLDIRAFSRNQSHSWMTPTVGLKNGVLDRWVLLLLNVYSRPVRIWVLGTAECLPGALMVRVVRERDFRAAEQSATSGQIVRRIAFGGQLWLPLLLYLPQMTPVFW